MHIADNGCNGPASMDRATKRLLMTQGEQWKKTTLKTALYFPGVCFCIFFCLNFLVWGQKSSGAGMARNR